MATVKLTNFTGITPRLGAQYLQDNAAQKAVNTKLFSGEIRSWMKPLEDYEVVNQSAATIFKMHGPGNATQWLEFNVDTDIVRGPVVDAEDYRIYYSENGVCKKTNWDLATEGSGNSSYPRNWLYLGVPFPTSAPTLTAERTVVKEDAIGEEKYDSENTENRVYVYTYVSEFGNVFEESAPSAAASVRCDASGNPVVISGFANPPTDHYNITRIRIYRAVAGATNILYMLVDEVKLKNHQFPTTGTSENGVSITDGEYHDSRTYAQLGMELATLNYTPPPENLRGLVMMANGFLAGYTYNQVWFSEPFIPHAWPADYMLSVDAEIVGLGVYGTTLVVCTKGHAYTISGTHPSALTQDKQPMVQPCVSKSSIAYDQYGVLYASPHGLVALAAAQMDVFTRPMITHDEWQHYTPSLLKSVMYNNMYIGAYHYKNYQGLVVFARGDQPAMIEVEFPAQALHVEYGTGDLYALHAYDHKIYKIDSAAFDRMYYTWQSKEFAFGYRMSFSCCKVDAQLTDIMVYETYKAQYDEAVAYNQEQWDAHTEAEGLKGEVNKYPLNAGNGFCVGGGVLKRLPERVDTFYVTITFIVDDKEIFAKTVTNAEIFRIPAISGYRWSLKLMGNMPVKSVTMATTVSEVNAG